MQWRLAKSLEKIRSQVDAAHPNRSKASDGTLGDSAHARRSSDHNPWVKDKNGIGVVTAIDITNDPAHGFDVAALVKSIVASKDPRVKYIIHNRQIWRSYDKPGIPRWTPARYTGSNPHTSHAHISVLPAPAQYDNGNAWRIKRTSSPPKSIKWQKRSDQKPGNRHLTLGCVGNDVGFVQRFLGITEDDKYGHNTSREVGAYQKMRGLPITGNVGKPTWDSMLRGK